MRQPNDGTFTNGLLGRHLFSGGHNTADYGPLPLGAPTYRVHTRSAADLHSVSDSVPIRSIQASAGSTIGRQFDFLLPLDQSTIIPPPSVPRRSASQSKPGGSVVAPAHQGPRRGGPSLLGHVVLVAQLNGVRRLKCRSSLQNLVV
ncbi:hypothetical protein NDU88_003294 [Pleurodeles waltl]|uniref:Uncharacterized protein n=1 Tax=Pleurodeles waltl TaxID=8319 RepID=A0AAV7VCY7_PLEWA|nr:hypothetical protein NDU88_003294 [Pleurodeles waltl]